MLKQNHMETLHVKSTVNKRDVEMSLRKRSSPEGDLSAVGVRGSGLKGASGWALGGGGGQGLGPRSSRLKAPLEIIRLALPWLVSSRTPHFCAAPRPAGLQGPESSLPQTSPAPLSQGFCGSRVTSGEAASWPLSPGNEHPLWRFRRASWPAMSWAEARALMTSQASPVPASRPQPPAACGACSRWD